MIRRPPRSTLDRSSAASDVYKRQAYTPGKRSMLKVKHKRTADAVVFGYRVHTSGQGVGSVSYTHLRAHETVLDLVCRLLLEKKKQTR